MKPHHYNLLLVALVTAILIIAQFLLTSLYWEHQAVIHHAAFFEASSWGNVSFHWEDDSYAHAPFQDASVWQNKLDQAFQQKLKSLNLN